MGLLKNIEWISESKNEILYKYQFGKKDQVNKGSALTVREGQAAIFIYKGQLADVYLPGFYKLDTDNMPILTKLMSWKYGFQTPFKADIYFVNTNQFTNQKWGTVNPILIRDADYGQVRVKGFGKYAFRVDDPYIFMKELSGATAEFTTEEINEYLRSMVLRGITDAIAELKIPVLDMAANLDELSKLVQNKMKDEFKEMGLDITKFIFESFSLPEELEKMIDKNAAAGAMRKNLDVYTQMETVQAMRDAAQNQNNGAMNTIMGVGLGQNMGAMMAGNMNKGVSQKTCPKCGAVVGENAKFCPECGANLKPKCPKCGTEVKAGTKFCPECGAKIEQ